jgi:predicted nucleotidyltransferase
MLEMLIPSQTRVKLLTLFLLNPGRSYYIREIERMTGEHYAAIHSELTNLESFGLLSKVRKGKQIYFSVNQNHSLYHELQKIVLKTEGIVRILKDEIRDLKGISCLFIYGSFAAGTAGEESDIDLFIVGEVDEGKIIPAVHAAEQILQREINYTLMSTSEYRERQQKKDPFVMNVLREPRVILEGCHD